MSWDAAQKRAEQAGTGNFVRLQNDKDKVIGIFCGEPHIRELVYNEKTKTYEDYTKEHEAQGKAPTPRFSCNFWVPKDKSMKIIEMNNATMKAVIALRSKIQAKWGKDKYFFEIERQGVKGDPKTTYTVLQDEEITPDEWKMIEGAKLHDLDKASRSTDAGDASTDMNSHEKGKANGANGTNGTHAAAPAGPALVDDATSAAIIKRLKPLPQDKIQAFLAKFAVKQVKSLKANEADAALKFLDELEGKPAPAPAAVEEVDPFA